MFRPWQLQSYQCSTCTNQITDCASRGGKQKKYCDDCRQREYSKNIRKNYARRRSDPKLRAYMSHQSRRSYLKLRAIPHIKAKLKSLELEFELLNEELDRAV